MFKKLPLLQAPEGDPPAGGGGTPPPDGGTPPPAAWYDNFQDPGVKDWVKSYGDAYKSPEAIALKAWNLEKFVGAEKAGRGVIVPKDGAAPEEWRAYFAKAGVPEKPDGYKLPEKLAADPIVGKFRDYAHKSGMPPMMLNTVMDFYQTEILAGADAQAKIAVENFHKKSEAEMNQLRDEWKGLEYDQNIEIARRAAKTFVPHENDQQLEEFMTSMEGAIGAKAMMKFFAAVGNGIKEHGFHQGEGGGDSVSTPEGARLRIAELKKDAAWTKKFMEGDVDSRKEWDALHKVAHGDKPA